MGFNPFKAAKKVVNKVAKPFRKVSQKLIPKEMRFALPYLAAATPFMLPAGGFGASGLFSSAAGRGFLSSLANVAGQAGVDPEGEDINLFSTGLAGLTGALSTPGMGENLRSGIERGIPYKDTMTDTVMRDGPGFFQGAENLGREGLATAADFLSGSKEGLSGLAANPENLVTKEGAKILGKVAAPIFVPGTADNTKAGADIALRDYLATDAAEQAEIEETTTADESERATLQMKFMRQAGIPEETVEETLIVNDLGDYYEPPVEAAAQGGIIGLKEGGMLNFGGREMDLRTGGFVPMGRKERADDVPARLSKNEFVMTADAVRAAGGGSVNEGAKRMYEVMNNLEARA